VSNRPPTPESPAYFLPPTDSTRERFTQSVALLGDIVKVEYQRGVKAVYERQGLPTLVISLGTTEQYDYSDTDTVELLPYVTSSIQYESPVDESEQWRYSDTIAAHGAHLDKHHAKWLDLADEATAIPDETLLLSHLEATLQSAPHPLEESTKKKHEALYNDNTSIYATWTQGNDTYVANHAQTIPQQRIEIGIAGPTYKYEQYADGRERLGVSNPSALTAETPIQSEPDKVTLNVEHIVADLLQAEALGFNDVLDGKMLHMTTLITRARASGIRILR
jgi:hypothetical protein